MEHRTTVHEVGEGGAQAVCSCGWRSPVFGTGKTAGTMDSLQRGLMLAICTSGETSLR